MQRYASKEWKAPVRSPSGYLEKLNSFPRYHLLRKCLKISKQALMEVNFQRTYSKIYSRFHFYLVKLIRAQGGCLGTKSR